VGEAVDRERVASELKGTTLRVYWYALKQNRVGVREVQRALNLSSPSVALHHIDKLSRMNLIVREPDGTYRVTEKVEVDIVKQFVRLGGLMVPRFLFYAGFFTTLLASYIIVRRTTLDFDNFMVLVLGISALIMAWYETIKAWSGRPD
jgi:DNA-binding transcriptional ArsR family regulator